MYFFHFRQINSGDSRRRRFSKFDDKVYGSRKMVQRLGLYKTLRKHTGCVNTLSFNDTGNILISGSDDRHVCLWDWARNKSVSHFHSGHTANVFQVCKAIPLHKKISSLKSSTHVFIFELDSRRNSYHTAVIRS